MLRSTVSMTGRDEPREIPNSLATSSKLVATMSTSPNGLAPVAEPDPTRFGSGT
jgi:hypothetical protein